ncbi:hypothetical protein PG989_006434 [Apiospora arundinis]
MKKYSVIGTWLLLNISEINNGVPTFPSAHWGAAPEGVILYTASGWVSANIIATEPEWRPTTKPHSAADLAAFANHSVAYTGPYTVDASFVPPADDPEMGAIVHGPLTVAVDPSDMGGQLHAVLSPAGGGAGLEAGAAKGCGWVAGQFFDHVVLEKGRIGHSKANRTGDRASTVEPGEYGERYILDPAPKLPL